METVKDFEEMEVWQTAKSLAVEVYSDFNEIRDFSFADQIKRAVVSISNNIAEGSGRASKTDFARFLGIAKGSAAEVRSMYRIARDLDFVDPPVAEERCRKCESIAKQLGGFTKHLRKS